MSHLLARQWWNLLARGLLAILFGILLIAFPGPELSALIVFFGAFALADGISNLTAASRPVEIGPQEQGLIGHGLVSMLAGFAALLWPAITAEMLLFVIALWAFATGAFEIAMSISLRKVIPNEWFLGLSGAMSILLGILLGMNPTAGMLAVTVLIGGYAAVFGMLTLALAWRIRAWARSRLRPGTPEKEQPLRP